MPFLHTFQRLFVASLFVALSTLSATAADVIRIPDLTTLQEGEVRRIQITGSIGASKSTILILQYPADVVRIRSVSGGDGFAWACQPVDIWENTTSGIVGNIVLHCDSIRPGSGLPLFELEVEGLYGAPRQGPLRPSVYVVDGDTVTDAQLIGGLVQLEGQGLQYQSAEALTGNYPNPFATETTFVFHVLEAGRVRLTIRNLQGRLIRDLGEVEANAGENTYHFDDSHEDLGQGAYLVEMVTDRGSYVHTFMVLR